MRMLIVGATGNVGSRVARQAAQAGHDVVAFVRRPEAVATDSHITVVKGAVEDTASLTEAARHVDVVFVAITGKMSDSSFMKKRMPGVITVLTNAGGPRIVVTSVFGAGDTFDKVSWFARVIYRTVLRGFLADKAEADQLVRESGLPYSLIYPVNLKVTKSKGSVDVVSKGSVTKVPGLPTLSMDEAARGILAVITEKTEDGGEYVLTPPRGWRA